MPSCDAATYSHRFHEGPIGPRSTKHTFRDNRVLSWSLFEIVASQSLTQTIAKLCALFESTDLKLLKCTSYSTTGRFFTA